MDKYKKNIVIFVSFLFIYRSFFCFLPYFFPSVWLLSQSKEKENWAQQKFVFVIEKKKKVKKSDKNSVKKNKDKLNELQRICSNFFLFIISKK